MGFFFLTRAPLQACQAADGSNNWGVFFDNFARQDVLWSQDSGLLKLWDISPATLSSSCNAPPLVGQLPIPAASCPSVNTQHSRDLFQSTSVPFACSNCTPTAANVCSYQLQVTDARCGSSYKIFFAESAAWPMSERLPEGQSVTGPGRMAMDPLIGGCGSAADACSPLLNNAEMSGHWCVVVAGGCSIATKVANCFGGSSANMNQVLGVIVIDAAIGATAGPTLTTSLNPIPFPVSVPVISISRTDGDRLAGAISSSVFTISKAIGPASYVPHAPGGLLTREHRTGQIFSTGLQRPGVTTFRFFAEPNRLFGWAFGLQVGSTTSNVGLFDLSTPQSPALLQQWSYAQLGMEPQLDVSPSNLIFVQQLSLNSSSFFWIIGNGTSFRFWNVTDSQEIALLSSSIPRVGGAFVNRAGTMLWTQTANSAGQVQGWRYQQAWDISSVAFPRLVGAFALDTSLLTPAGRGSALLSLGYPTFDSWGSNLVSYNLGDNGIAFYNYSNPTSVTLAAYRDTSPSSCSPLGSGIGPSGAIVPSPQPNVWLSCRAYESSPTFSCGSGRVNPPVLDTCQATYPASPRIDFVAYQVLPNVVNDTDCDDGATVQLFFNRQTQ